jgi:tetrahydromethanopterin S-methyltransferase subunit G
MKHVAAYLLLALGGKEANAASIKAVITAAGGEADDDEITRLLAAMEGKVRAVVGGCVQRCGERAGRSEGWGDLAAALGFKCLRRHCVRAP